MRHPYLNGQYTVAPKALTLTLADARHAAWLPGNLASNAPRASAQFWDGTTLNWAVIARVDGQNYALFGATKKTPYRSVQTAQQNSINYTSTHTYIDLNAGLANFVLDFFTPVSPTNLLRQSLPYSYLTVYAQGTNGAKSDIQIFSSIDDTWYGGQSPTLAANASAINSTTLFQLSDPDAIRWYQAGGMAAWGSTVFASRPSSSSKLSYQCGSTASVFRAFSKGSLADGSLPQNCQSSDTFALAHDLGSVGSQTSVTFAIGQDRFEAINYLGNAQASFVYSSFDTVPLAVSHFFDDLSNATTEAQTIDNMVRSKAEVISSNYADIIEAIPRQVYEQSILDF